MGQSITNGNRLIALENRIKALEMRKAGKTYEFIGKRLGVSTQRAYQYCMEEFKRLRETCTETAEEALQLALRQIDDLYKKVLPKVAGKKGKDGVTLSGDWRAADTCLRLIAQKAKLLGIEAPVKVEYTGVGNMTEAELLIEAARRGLPVVTNTIPLALEDRSGEQVPVGVSGRGDDSGGVVSPECGVPVSSESEDSVPDGAVDN